MHFRMATEDAWHAVGHALAPKAQWQGILDSPGTIAVTLKGRRPGHPEAALLVTVEPSSQLPAGVFVSFNEHADVPSVADALRRIDTHYEAACAHALESAQKIVRFGSAS
jgi:hypothetical protein